MTKRFWLSVAALAIAAAAAAYYQFGDVAAEVPVLNSAEATRSAVVSIRSPKKSGRFRS